MTDAVFLHTRRHQAGQAIGGSPAHLLLAAPQPHLSAFDRTLLRCVLRASSSRVGAVSGLHHVSHLRDPFILVLNHSTMLEALIVPALLLAARGGRALPFLADWNFRLIPGVGLLYKRANVVNVTRKPARPRKTDVFGLPMQIVVCLMGIVVAVLSVTGLMIYLRKQRASGSIVQRRR